MKTRNIIAFALGAAAMLAAVPASAATAPKPAPKHGVKPHIAKVYTLCASKAGKLRLATKLRPCSRWETKIPVAPVQQPKHDDRPVPYYLREGNVTKYCAPAGKWRGVWVVDCKVVGQRPEPSPEPTPTQTENPEPSPTATSTGEPAA